MEKLPMCRICLVQNARMFLVVNKNLHELYEKLTDIPFVTEDSRPILACFICCAKLKQCYQLLRQCLEAEELFAQKINGDYELNPIINQDHFEFYSGFIKSPTENISIVDECETESIAIKDEISAVCEGRDGIIEPKEEHQSDELELENFDNIWLDEADIPPHDSESDLEDDVPLMEFKTEVEEEQEVSKKKRRTRETKRVPIAKKPRRAKLEDTITAEQKKNQPLDSKFIRTVRNCTSKCVTKFKEPVTTVNTTVTTCNMDKSDMETVIKLNIIQQTNNLSTAIDMNCRRNSNKDNCMRKIRNNKGIQSNDVNTQRFCTGEKVFKCDLCSRRFTTKRNFKLHNYKHTGEKPYKCDVCQRSFTRPSNLKVHIRQHTGEKPYKCDVCQRSFAHKSSFHNHIRTHTGEKPYKCDVCQRSFAQQSNLITHTRQHTGEKPYECDVCQRSFTHKNSFDSHIRTHTGEKPYKCDVCQRSFAHKNSLQYHSRCISSVPLMG